MKKAYDTIIIGAGVVGCSTALQLAKQGLKIAVIDQNKKPGFGTTSYSSAISRSCYTNLESVKTAYEGYHILKNWRDFLNLPKSKVNDDNLAKLVDLNGFLLMTNNDSKKFIDLTVPLMKKAGVPVKFLSRSELDKMFGDPFKADLNNVYDKPRLISDPKFGQSLTNITCQGGYLMEATGYVNDPQLATRNLVDACSKYWENQEGIVQPTEFMMGSKHTCQRPEGG